jgi:curved DNA-binding protein CbpA
MFRDYYAILEIEVSASQDDIKDAFKKQALIWHPDRNVGKDTTLIMQDINEAKLILLDTEARERYNQEYARYKNFERIKEGENEQKARQRDKQKQHQENTSQGTNYKVDDEILNKWMNNAKKQSVDLAKETIEDFKGMTKVGIKAASENIGDQIPSLLIMAVFFLLLFVITRSCNN